MKATPLSRIVCILVLALAGQAKAQDTIVLPDDTIIVGELEWEIFNDFSGTQPQVTEFEELYGKKIQIFLDFHPSGSVEQIVFGYMEKGKFVPHGPARYYYSLGELLGKRRYEKGALQGLAEDYYPLGKIKLRSHYRDDSLHGELIAYYENGPIKERGTFADGREEGLYRTWYSNGVRKSTSTFAEGHLEGPDTAFYETGSIEAIVHYAQDSLQGRAVFFHRNGRTWSARQYEGGALREVEFVKDGQGDPLPIGSFKDGEGELFIYNDRGRHIATDTYRGGRLIRTKDLD